MAGRADDADQRALARLEQLTEESRSDLGTFITLTSPRHRRPLHLRPLTQLLDRAMHEPVFATVSVPPRHFKTETLLHGVARVLRDRPGRMNAYATYSSDFAERKSRLARSIATRANVPMSAVRGHNPFSPASTLNYWQTSAGGGFLAVGRGAGFTGDGVTGLLVIDDPHKDRQEAESARTRQEVWDWFTDVALLRVEETGSIIVTHTRWHEDDLIGRIRRSGDFEDWVHINLPALAEEGKADLLGRKPGEALLPWKFPAEKLEKRRRQIGEYSWYSLYQGEPRPRGGRLFGPAHYYRDLPDTALVYGYGADMAYTAKTSSDYSVRIWLAKTRDALFRDIFYILHVERMQVAAPEFARVLQADQRRQPAPVFWRAVGPERGSADLMNSLMGVPFQVLPTTGDKFIHAQPVAAAWNDGRVLLPSDNPPWMKDFLAEVQAFTGVNDPEDDQVDALGNAFDGLAGDVELDLESDFEHLLPKLSI
jgi:predicted phage terminase large subunit-like protein